MEIITSASAKGGVSKSLLSINLYFYLKDEEQKKVLLIDTDKQQSSSTPLQKII
ncbi:AAA family ATPase [Moraxella catarrhalis]|uniref:AAA family ATPase n=1 Tax=Moraxella catarrhalis TaxID=480 RepID=UPI0007F368AD|nr:ParA family protein [Moraxella catarrhalis]OAV31194.1 hypothetical protein AO368_0735 [Moraxella catarrhalis]STY80846.1 CobQ/CobB/MinD/ParA nucleotide binding domain [Moraxella catarrhalis]